jgi:hypothetical protein
MSIFEEQVSIPLWSVETARPSNEFYESLGDYPEFAPFLRDHDWKFGVRQGKHKECGSR